MDGRPRRLLAAVLLVANAHGGLDRIKDGQDPVDHGDAGGHRDVRDAGGSVVGDQIEMQGLSLDDTSQTDHRVVDSRLGEPARHHGNLEGSRDPRHVRAGRTLLTENFLGPIEEALRGADVVMMLRIQREQDASVAFRFACRVAMCGSCGMVINGIERLACKTNVSDLPAGADITLRPMNHFPVIKDLVVDMDPFFSKMRQTLSFFEPKEQLAEPARIAPDAPERALPPLAPDRETARKRFAERREDYALAERRIPVKGDESVQNVVAQIFTET